MRNKYLISAVAAVLLAAVPVNAGKPWLKGKNLFTLFDSLGQTGVWQERLAELSGMNFDSEGNFNYINPISYGGSCTGLYGPVCGMQRARNLAEVAKTTSVDYLMIANTNDIGQFSNLGTLDDAPWFWSYTHFVPECGLVSKQEAGEYWRLNFSAIAGDMKPEAGAVARIPFTDGGTACEAEFVSGPVRDGTINLHCREFTIPIPVKAGMSAEELTDFFMKVALRPGCDCIRLSATKVSMRDFIKGVNTFRFDCGDTGVAVEARDAAGMATYDRFFTGKDTSEWMNPACWTSAPTVYAQWKGFMDYVTEHFSTARIYWFIPTYYMTSPENEAIKGAYFDAQKKLAEYYHVPVLDIYAESGINESNLLDFYRQGDVHPKDSGYIRWGETVYRLLKRR